MDNPTKIEKSASRQGQEPVVLIKEREPAKPRVLDLFAGAGGFSLGFHWAGYSTLVAIDHDPASVETLDANYAHLGTTSLVRDLAIFSPLALRRYLEDNSLTDEFDVLLGGPPCQGWSKVGRGKLRSLKNSTNKAPTHADPRNKLYKSFIEFVDNFRPKAAVMENVPGMLSHDRRNAAELVASSLEDIGYTVSWQLLNAADYGVPQVRERLFFVGIRKDLNLTFEFPPSRKQDGTRLFDEVRDLRQSRRLEMCEPLKAVGL